MTRDDQRYVTDLCDDILGVPALREHTFDWLRGDPAPPRFPRGKRLPVDAYWPSLGLVMEFHERQHTESVKHFDHPERITVSGVQRGGPDGQRRLYDLRRVELVPAHGLRLVIIPQSAFVLRSKKIDRRPERDRAVVVELLGAIPSQNPSDPLGPTQSV